MDDPISNLESVGEDSTKNEIKPSFDKKNVLDLAKYVNQLLQQMLETFESMSNQIITKIDEMGGRIEDLERNITDLMTQIDPAEEAETESTVNKS